MRKGKELLKLIYVLVEKFNKDNKSEIEVLADLDGGIIKIYT